MVTWCSLIVLLTLASAFGRERWYSWIGTPERHLGVLTWALFLVAFVAGFQLWPMDSTGSRGEWRWRRCGLVGTPWSSTSGGPRVVFTSDSSRLGGPFGSPPTWERRPASSFRCRRGAVDDRQSA